MAARQAPAGSVAAGNVQGWSTEENFYEICYGDILEKSQGATDFALYYNFPKGGDDATATCLSRCKIYIMPDGGRDIQWQLHLAQAAGNVSGFVEVKNVRTKSGAKAMYSIAPHQLRKCQLQKTHGNRLYLGNIRAAFCPPHDQQDFAPPASERAGAPDASLVMFTVVCRMTVRTRGPIANRPNASFSMRYFPAGYIMDDFSLVPRPSRVFVTQAGVVSGDLTKGLEVYENSHGHQTITGDSVACFQPKDTDALMFEGNDWQTFLDLNVGQFFSLQSPCTLTLVKAGVKTDKLECCFKSCLVGPDDHGVNKMWFFAIASDAAGTVYCGSPQMENISPIGESDLFLRRVILDVLDSGEMAITRVDETYQNIVDVRMKSSKKKGKGRGQYKTVSKVLKVPKPLGLDPKVNGFFYFKNSATTMVNTRSVWFGKRRAGDPPCLAHNYSIQQRFNWPAAIRGFTKLLAFVSELIS